MNEFLIIKKYLSNLSKKNKGSFNLSDDIFLDYKKKIGISTDTYVEGIHFLNFNNPDLVITKIIRSSISDLICKSIIPKYYFISFSGNSKNLTKKKIQLLTLALKKEQKKYKIILCGGDTTNSKVLSITICSVGYAQKKTILRKGAKINDDIYVTNTLGDAFIGLKVLKNQTKLSKNIKKYFIKKFYLPNLPLNFSKNIHLFASSSIDISDGFFQDLNHLLERSNVSAEILLNKIPISKSLNLFIKNKRKNKLNLISNGDDYQCLFTAKKSKRSLINKISKKTYTKVTCVGTIKKKSNSYTIKLIDVEHKLPKKLGYMHNFF